MHFPGRFQAQSCRPCIIEYCVIGHSVQRAVGSESAMQWHNLTVLVGLQRHTGRRRHLITIAWKRTRAPLSVARMLQEQCATSEIQPPMQAMALVDAQQWSFTPFGSVMVSTPGGAGTSSPSPCGQNGVFSGLMTSELRKFRSSEAQCPGIAAHEAQRR